MQHVLVSEDWLKKIDGVLSKHTVTLERIEKNAPRLINENRDCWMNTADAALYVGWSERTMYRKAEELGAVKRGGSWKFKKSTLDEYMRNN